MCVSGKAFTDSIDRGKKGEGVRKTALKVGDTILCAGVLKKMKMGKEKPSEVSQFPPFSTFWSTQM